MTRATDVSFMRRALALAPKGIPLASPNPIVGCVLVKGGRVIGQGWHKQCGREHAETNALADAKRRGNSAKVAGGTAYVTLEPCSHWGKQPPCADALVAAKVARVVFAAHDSNPLVNGKGHSKLSRAGILVTGGVLEAEAREENRSFFSRIEKKRPFVTVKLGVSSDGKIAGQPGKWITSPVSLRAVQRLRAESDAVLVGVGTVLADDPRLNVRVKTLDGRVRQPLRVIIDSHVRMPPTARVFTENGGAVRVYTTRRALNSAVGKRAARALEKQGAVVVGVPSGASGRVSLPAVLADLGRLPVNSVLVEAGQALASEFLASGLVDELRLFIAPTPIGAAGLDAFTPRALACKVRARLAIKARSGRDGLRVFRFGQGTPRALKVLLQF